MLRPFCPPMPLIPLPTPHSRLGGEDVLSGHSGDLSQVLNQLPLESIIVLLRHLRVWKRDKSPLRIPIYKYDTTCQSSPNKVFREICPEPRGGCGTEDIEPRIFDVGLACRFRLVSPLTNLPIPEVG